MLIQKFLRLFILCAITIKGLCPPDRMRVNNFSILSTLMHCAVNTGHNLAQSLGQSLLNKIFNLLGSKEYSKPEINPFVTGVTSCFDHLPNNPFRMLKDILNKLEPIILICSSKEHENEYILSAVFSLDSSIQDFFKKSIKDISDSLSEWRQFRPEDSFADLSRKINHKDIIKMQALRPKALRPKDLLEWINTDFTIDKFTNGYSTLIDIQNKNKKVLNEMAKDMEDCISDYYKKLETNLLNRQAILFLESYSALIKTYWSTLLQNRYEIFGELINEQPKREITAAIPTAKNKKRSSTTNCTFKQNKNKNNNSIDAAHFDNNLQHQSESKDMHANTQPVIVETSKQLTRSRPHNNKKDNLKTSEEEKPDILTQAKGKHATRSERRYIMYGNREKNQSTELETDAHNQTPNARDNDREIKIEKDKSVVAQNNKSDGMYFEEHETINNQRQSASQDDITHIENVPDADEEDNENDDAYSPAHTAQRLGSYKFSKLIDFLETQSDITIQRENHIIKILYTDIDGRGKTFITHKEHKRGSSPKAIRELLCIIAIQIKKSISNSIKISNPVLPHTQ